MNMLMGMRGARSSVRRIMIISEGVIFSSYAVKDNFSSTSSVLNKQVILGFIICPKNKLAFPI